ncbi:hypothetical protein BH09MYX1_BH09MYX1_60470 [soil metagenome]
MAVLGQARSGLVAGAYVAAAVIGCAALWGFTVDDALISVQYARNIVNGVGYRFDPGGSVTDGVTPLPWPVLLLPFAKGTALEVLLRARVLGAALYILAAAALGRRVSEEPAPRWAAIGGAVVLGLCVPAAAHAVSGMETAVVVFLATLAVVVRGDRTSALLAGAAAAFRPELIPWALAHSVLRAPADARSRVRSGALAFAFPLVVVALRVSLFGHAAPLAIHAKPADLSQGVAYALAAALSSATPFVGVSIAGLRVSRSARAIIVAFFVHLLAVAAAGGDWMPLARLVAPLAPGLVLAFVLAASEIPRWSLVLRGLLVAGFGWIPLLVGVGTARFVFADRRAMIEAATPELAQCSYIAAADVGWVSAAAPGRRILDLGGLTDPEIAYLPGSHTSKRVDASMLLDRHVDCVLLYVEGPSDLATWRASRFAHAVDARLARSDLFADRYTPTHFIPLGRPLPDGMPVHGYLLLHLGSPL